MLDVDVENFTGIARIIADEPGNSLFEIAAIAEPVDRGLGDRKSLLDIFEDHRGHLRIEAVHSIGIGGESIGYVLISGHAWGPFGWSTSRWGNRGSARRQSTCQRAPEHRC